MSRLAVFVSILVVSFFITSATSPAPTDDVASHILTASKLLSEYQKILREESKKLDEIDVTIQDIKYLVKTRAHRDIYLCGKRILDEVVKVCGGTSEQAIGTEIDMSVCCNQKCNDEFIKTAMCPVKKD
ncbi:hypothetical protein CAEBREN_02361 [Caenorhabditis brenneri]|uniref:Uncharacterized protein n=1 Tax=Caenorhabditis brenneri TaxID=135651 RepID=G0MMU5_CAEBE|nr:hypothetical protein CAEBREN_02361 [Caenorhabditis brenneri]